MRTRFTALIWTALASAVIGTLGWAVYAARAYLFLARAFPSTKADAAYGIAGVLASIQGYAVAFGPLALAMALATVLFFLERRRHGGG